MKFRFRYSLRTFLVLLIMMPAALGIWIRRSLDQPKHVRYLQGLGLKVVYDLDQTPGDNLFEQARLGVATRFGKDFVSVPVTVEPGRTVLAGVYTEDLIVLAKLRWLRSLEFHRYHSIDDQGLAIIARLPCLESLTINTGLVTDKGLAALHGCRSLKKLALFHTHVTDAAAEQFALRLPTCRVERVGEPREDRSPDQLIVPRRPDRLLTPLESQQLDAAIHIFEEPDPLIRYQLIQVVDLNEPLKPEDFEDPEFAKAYAEFQETLPSEGPTFGFAEAIFRLQLLGHADAIPELERIARNASSEIVDFDDFRRQAIRALGHIADRRVIPILLDLLEDKNRIIALEAWQYLYAMTGKPEGDDLVWYSRRDTYPPPELIARWRKFWKENGDVLRPRHASLFNM